MAVADRAARIFSIPPGVSFVDALAVELLRETAGEPLALSRYTILLPTRRARRALDEAFLRQSDGRPLLLPRVLPLGDLDADETSFAAEDEQVLAPDLPPAIPGLRRQLLLTQAIQAAGRAGGSTMSVDQATRLASDLARLLDQVQTERVTFDRLRDLVPEDYAAHWQITLRFLSVLTDAWPRILADEGCIDPADRRNRALAAQAEAWRRSTPAAPVIAAGSTGSIPATADLLEVVADLPTGRVVLPGLDSSLNEATREAVLADPSHPQHGLMLLLDRLGVAPADVQTWPAEDPKATLPLRARLVAEALRPAVTTDAWRTFAAELPEAAVPRRALDGVRRIDSPGPQEEAGVIALLLRGILEMTEKRAALVTPDRGLARRVAAEMRRWDIDIDDSAGQPLDRTPPGAFLRLTAEMLAEEAAPVPLLALLKHPLAAGGQAPATFRDWVRRLEIACLRGPRPGQGFAGLKRALPKERAAEFEPMLDHVADLAAPMMRLVSGRNVTLIELIDAHVAFAEGLATSEDEGGAARLWAGDAGEAAANFIADLRQAARGFAPIAGDRYPALLGDLLAAQVVRPRYNRQPRLAIWGPLEARLQHADLLILGGLNEGTWPAEITADPWLSRPMRRDFGLAAPERRIGLAAHDFAQAMGAAEVVLTRSLRVEGTPTVPSRWLLRLDGLLRALGLDGAELRQESWPSWQAGLDRPVRVATCEPPAPRPPVPLRPRKLSVTEVETWRRDPYAIYARHVLRLKALEAIDADLTAADRGSWIHGALEKFAGDYPRELPSDSVERLLDIGRRHFTLELSRPVVAAFWWPRFRQIAQWFVERERARRTGLAQIRAEVRGRLTLNGAAGPFELKAKADRIDLGKDGRLTIIDYKTGALPPKQAIELGIAPQLPLEAAIAEAGGFAGVAAAPVAALEYWRLSGGHPAGEVRPLKGDPAAFAADALDGLQRLIAEFDVLATAYHAIPDPALAPAYSDYAHLARVQEWSAGATGDGE